MPCWGPAWLSPMSCAGAWEATAAAVLSACCRDLQARVLGHFSFEPHLHSADCEKTGPLGLFLRLSE